MHLLNNLGNPKTELLSLALGMVYLDIYRIQGAGIKDLCIYICPTQVHTYVYIYTHKSTYVVCSIEHILI